MKMSITREWAMPNHETFSISPINKLIDRILRSDTDGIWIDPFVRNSKFKQRMAHTNDLSLDFEATQHSAIKVSGENVRHGTRNPLSGAI